MMSRRFTPDDPLTRRVRELAEPVCAANGVDCYLVEVSGPRGRRHLRVYIDAIDGVDIDDCTRVSQQLSAVLDVEDPIDGPYQLEVSSPGLNRPLRDLTDLRAVIGRKVYLETAEPIGNRRRFSGQLTGIDGETIVMLIDGQELKVPAAAVRKAHLQHSFDND
jgi:ribosome maturation factor RimP